VSSYLTFSTLPVPLQAIGGVLSAALSIIQVFNPKPLPVRKRDALRCPDFPLDSRLRVHPAIEQLAFCAKI